MTFCQPSLRTESANGLKGRAAKLFVAGGERRRRIASTVDPTLIRGFESRMKVRRRLSSIWLLCFFFETQNS